MRRTPLQIVSLKGSPLDVSWDLGKKRASKIRQRVEFWNREISTLYRGKKDRLKTLEKSFLKEAAAAPHYLEEIRAMAEGAGVPFTDLFRLNLTELKVFVDKCTTVAFKVKSQKVKKSKGKILIAHNEDWEANRNDVFILQVQLPKVSYQIIAYDGYLPGLSCGQNSFGMSHAINYLKPEDFRIGLPRIFITRHMVTTPSFSDADHWIRKNKRAFGQSIHLAKGGRYINYELTAKKVFVRKPQLPAAHANHYITRDVSEAGINSLTRQSRADELLQKFRAQKLTLAQAKKIARQILSDEQSPPHNIWRDGKFAEDGSVTLCTTLISTGGVAMEVFRDRLKTSKAIKVSF